MNIKEKIVIIKRGIKTVEEMDKGRAALIIAGKLLNMVQSFFHIYIVTKIIDMVAAARPWRDIFVFMAATSAAELAIFIALQTLDRRKDSHQFRYNAGKRRMLWQKIINMDYVHIENPETHILHHRAQQGIERMQRFIYDILDAAVGLVSAAAGAAIIAPLAFRSADGLDGFAGFISSVWGLAAAAAAVALIEIARGLYNSKRSYKFLAELNNNRTTMQYGRTAHYYIENVLRNYNNGKDIRIYNEQELIRGEYGSNINNRLESWRRSLRRVFKAHFVMDALMMTSSMIMYGFAVGRAVAGVLTVGEIVGFVMYFSKIRQGISTVTNGLSNSFMDTEFVQYVYDFLDIPDEKYRGTIPTEKRDDNEYEFEFSHVYFKYPNSEQYVLKDVNLKWRIGEKMALVGRNGCGKSTLVKLLCRLYDPTEGSITLNGIDIKKYKYEDYMALFSVVFQDSELFSLSIAENVAADTEYDGGRVSDCVIRAGLGERLSQMESGIETCLYKYFDEQGVEISGGEAQKLCLARAIYKSAPFIVLDEPTASLDPISEHDIYTKFNGIVGTKTAVYISHRLSSCRFCDEITVMEDGRIAERGSHDSLIAKGGVYKALWEAQAEYYKDTAGDLYA